MLIFGIVALIKGKFSLTRGRVVEGVPARIIGLVLCLPFPLGFVIGLALGIGAAAAGRQIDPMSVMPLDLGLTLGCLVLAVGIAIATAKPTRSKRLRREEDDDYDEEDDRPRRARRRPREDDDEEEDLPRRRRRRREDDEDDERDRGDEHIK